MIKLKTILQESIIGNKIHCNKCNWNWKIADGGDDLYICHKCGHDNTPKLTEKDQIVQTDDPSKIKKLRIVFANDTKIENALSKLFVRLGLVTKTFTSIQDAIQYVMELRDLGVSDLEELVIGSHGTTTGTKLIGSSKKDQSYGKDFEYDDGSKKWHNYDEALLIACKDLINSSTNVFFTACYGADQLNILVHAANILGTTVYGAAGVSAPGLNRILNKFSKKIFKCTPAQEGLSNEMYLEKQICSNTNSPIRWLRVKA